MKTYKLGLVGEKLGHSFSPAIHAKLGTPDYKLFELQPDELGEFLQKGDFDGLNVTIPYKKAVMPYCTELTDQAKRIGSVNTIVRRNDGTLLGHNTDYDGFSYTLRRVSAVIEGKKCLILGTGGASLTVRTVLQDMKAREIVFISRTGENNYQNLELHEDAQIIVNTTPVGMWPNNGKAALDVSRFPRLEGVFDLVYNPARTQIMLDAERCGVTAVGGLAMLVAQAKAASERFRNISLADDLVEKIAAEMETQSKNLLLVGAAGSGKGYVGAELARLLGRPFVQLTGKDYNRLREVCGKSGQVISVAEAVVTRNENTDPLRENSVVIWLKGADADPVLEEHCAAVAELTLRPRKSTDLAEEIIRRLHM